MKSSENSCSRKLKITYQVYLGKIYVFRKRCKSKGSNDSTVLRCCLLSLLNYKRCKRCKRCKALESMRCIVAIHQMMYSAGSSGVSLTTGIVVSVADGVCGRSRLRLVRHQHLRLFVFFAAVKHKKGKVCRTPTGV